MHHEEPSYQRPRFWIQAGFSILLVLVISVWLVAYASVRDLQRGKQLTEQRCNTCHSFSKNEPSYSEVTFINTALISDDELMQHFSEASPPANFPKDVADQKLILQWLRYMESRDAAIEKAGK